MCQSKADGGRRCASADARYRLKRAVESGNATENDLAGFNAGVRQYGHIVRPMSIGLPNSVSEAFGVLREVGNPLLVGGTVRDALRGMDPKDFDIEVHEASMDDIAKLLKSNGYHVDEVGKAFGVLKVRVRGEDLDISVPRRDSLAGEGHRGFTIETDAFMGVTEASARRDYTINSIMYDPHHGVMIDPHSGYDDLKSNVLRHVSDAFADDPLRPLRGVQFAARYNMKVHPDTAELSARLRSRYNELAQERVRDEWMKFHLKGKYPSAGLRALEESGWSDTVTRYDLINHDALDAVAGEDITLRTAVMTRDMNDVEAREFLKQTIVGDRQVSSSYALSRAVPPSEVTDYEVRQWTRQLGKKGVSVRDWERREHAFGVHTSNLSDVARHAGVFENAPVDLFNGDDIVASAPDRQAGRWVGELLSDAQKAQDREVFTTRSGALEWISSKSNN